MSTVVGSTEEPQSENVITQKDVSKEQVPTENPNLSLEVDEETLASKYLPISTGIMTPLTAVFMFFAVSAVAALYGIIYLGVLWDPLSHLNSLPFAYLNNDRGFNFTGYEPYQSTVLKLTQNQTFGEIGVNVLFKSNSSLANLLGWVEIPSTMSESELNEQLEKGDYWGYIYIPENFSNNFLSNLQNPKTHLANPNYQNMTVDFVHNQARQITISGMYSAAVNAGLEALSSQLANDLLNAAEKDTQNGYNALLTTPRFISRPIHSRIVNIHPVPFLGLNFATYISGLVLWITGLVTVTLIFRTFVSNFDLISHTYSQKLFRPRFILTAVVFGAFYTFLSTVVIYLLLLGLSGNTSFLQPNYNSFQLIMYLWLMSVTFTSTSALLCSIMGVDYFAIVSSMFLILQLATSSAIIEPVVMPSLGKIGYVFPFGYSVKALKCMFMGSMCNSMSMNIWVLFVWTGVTLLTTFVLVMTCVRRRIDKVV
ncbi:hypothetical protein BC833DRAFT_607868 [Globomyces pollinis-pini]|nr:hypothetical protein BC833DRAFT_607868 [Globomyces pollinis-pini]